MPSKSRVGAPVPVPVAKVARPRMMDLQPRRRLFSRLDALRRDHPIPWIAAPAGSGKTSLLVSYVEARKIPTIWYRVDEGDRHAADLFFYMRLALEVFEHSRRAGLELPSFSAKVDVGHFSRRFFEAFFARLPAGALLALDDYHLATDDSSWQLAMEKLVAGIPPTMNVVVLSRRAPPAALVRARVHGEIGFLERAEIQLTEGEVAALAKRRFTGTKKTKPSSTDLKQIHEATGGWAAGVSLLLRRNRPEALPARRADAEMQPIFDYLASAVFSELAANAQRVLLYTAFLPSFSAGQAAELSGVSRADQELRALYRSGFFLECDDAREDVYHFHPLFRSFLAYRAVLTLGPAELKEVRARAALLLRADGRDEGAFELLLEIGNFESLTELIVSRAPALFAEGRITLLNRWLSALPIGLVHGGGWLSYWKGMCALTGTPAASRAEFERALERFIAARDGAGAYLAWAGAAHALTYEARTWRGIQRWLDRLADIERFCPVFPSADVGCQVVSALLMGFTLAGAEASMLESWAARAMSLAENTNDPTVRVMSTSVLLLHYALYGDAGRAAVLVAKLAEREESGPAGFVARVAAKGAMAALAWHQGDLADSLAAAREGIALMADSVVPMWQSALLVFGSLSALEQGDPAQVSRFLKRLSQIAEAGSPLDVSAYHAIRARQAIVRGDLAGALLAIELSLDSARAVGFSWGQGGCLIITTYLAFELKEPERASAALAAVMRLEDQSGDPVLAYWRLVIQADRALREGDRPSAIDFVGRAFTLGRDQQLFANHCPTPDRIAELCRLALQEGIEPEYVRTLVRRRGLVADPPPLDVPDWPWPIKIFTLGQLEVSVGDLSVTLGRGRMIPLLLKTIVALGAEAGARRIAVARIIAALWPDTDGDAANHAFEMTLLRLRKQIGPEGHRAIQLENERLSIHRSVCWTDIDALEVVLKEIAGLDRTASNPDVDPDTLAALGERLLALYRGGFADGDNVPPALVAFDGRLRARVSGAVLALGRRHEQRALPALAESLYLRALESDPLLEALRGPAAHCIARRGRPEEARAFIDGWRHHGRGVDSDLEENDDPNR